jgi:murein DD-endopeptidase MepM/ murein hydrolase activator NlpD
MQDDLVNLDIARFGLMADISDSIRNSRQLLVIYYLVTIHLVAIYLLTDKIFEDYALVPVAEHETHASPTPASPSQAPADESSTTVPGTAALPKPSSQPPAGKLIIPVLGVRPEQLIDSFADARSDGRVHDAIDIAAPAGTPVLAAADGKIIKFWESAAGGTTIYQMSLDQKYVYYYAHLAGRAADVSVGDVVKQGRTIGFVGDTGNAGAGNYHLHFSISAISDPNRYWEGSYIDPYPLLRR